MELSKVLHTAQAFTTYRNSMEPHVHTTVPKLVFVDVRGHSFSQFFQLDQITLLSKEDQNNDILFTSRKEHFLVP